VVLVTASGVRGDQVKRASIESLEFDQSIGKGESAMASPAAPQSTRNAGSLPFPDIPVGTANEQMPFDHLVVVMMENHSFDNLLGGLSRTRSDVDGLSFDSAGNATNTNPSSDGGLITAHALRDTSQAQNLTQHWQPTHEQINGGAMDGFVKSSHDTDEPMGYYTPEVLPFAYSLAETYTLANRWFCSLPGPTYPNRRFLLAGTAFGGTETGKDSLIEAFEKPPPGGTIFDLLSHHEISWRDYFTDIPMSLVLPRTLKHVTHHRFHHQFLEDCRAGSLPAVSFVDPAVGALSSIARSLDALPRPLKDLLERLGPSETEEDPGDMYYGERWAHEITEAVVRSPAWPRTLLIYTYDEHGGYYDHVPPPAAIPPDEIEPQLPPGRSGAYDRYGPRVPAVVVSPYSRPGGVTDVVHDHTSVLATIEHKWNLPALTARDANAATVMDFLDLDGEPRLDPPALIAPSSTGPSGPAAKPA
jgi:phospholipase C